MAITPTTAYAAKNELAHKTPIYTASFQTTVGGTDYIVTNLNTSFPLWLEQAQESWTPNEWEGYTCVITTRRGEQITRIVNSNTTNQVTFNYSLPMGSVEVDDEFRLDFYTEFCTYQPVDDLFDLKYPRKPYISYISGGGYSITPDEGSKSSATLKIEMQDKNNEVTEMIHNATGQLQKKTCIVKAGYLGLNAQEMLTIFTGEITDYNYSKDGSWTFSLSDVIRDLNKNIFRDASDDNPNEILGNPINLLLGLLISNTGDGTKGVYDFMPQGYGLDMPVSKIDIEGFESIRDEYYPLTTTKFHFIMTERESANDFFKDAFFKPLNMYPITLGDGRYSAKIYRQPLPPYVPYEINESDMLDIPKFDGNLSSLINEVQYEYNYDDADEDYEDILVYADADSINTRGVGDQTLEITCRGLKDEYMDTATFLDRSVNRIFARYAEPPVKLSVELMYKYLLIETGDIVLVSNKFLPNLRTGAFDFENVPMEVLKRTVDWKRGKVKLELLQTGYADRQYAAISPVLTVATPVDATSFTVSDLANFAEGFKVSHWRPVFEFERADDPGTSTRNEGTRPYYHNELLESDLTITEINGLVITISGLSNAPLEGDFFAFTDTGTDLTEYQQRWGRIGAGYLITP